MATIIISYNLTFNCCNVDQAEMETLISRWSIFDQSRFALNLIFTILDLFFSYKILEFSCLPSFPFFVLHILYLQVLTFLKPKSKHIELFSLCSSIYIEVWCFSGPLCCCFCAYDLCSMITVSTHSFKQKPE